MITTLVLLVLVLASALGLALRRLRQLRDTARRRSLEATAEELRPTAHYRPYYEYAAPAQLRAALDRVWQLQKELMQSGRATTCRQPARSEELQRRLATLMLCAFNGETEAATARVTWSNVRALEEQIKQSFEMVNRLGAAHHVQVARAYLDLALAGLRLTHEHALKLEDAAEAQRRLRQRQRDDEAAQLEATRARDAAETDERRYAKALARARADLPRLRNRDLAVATLRIQQLEHSIAVAQQHAERARAILREPTSGHVYIASNIGAFGEGVFKIGMTRRLDPYDHVKELGDAAVPFPFDVHAMIPAADAPALERAFHDHFHAHRLNVMHDRRFFAVSIDQLEDFVMRRGLAIDLAKTAEAREHRESLAARSERRPRLAVGTGLVSVAAVLGEHEAEALREPPPSPIAAPRDAADTAPPSARSS